MFHKHAKLASPNNGTAGILISCHPYDRVGVESRLLLFSLNGSDNGGGLRECRVFFERHPLQVFEEDAFSSGFGIRDSGLAWFALSGSGRWMLVARLLF